MKPRRPQAAYAAPRTNKWTRSPLLLPAVIFQPRFGASSFSAAVAGSFGCRMQQVELPGPAEERVGRVLHFLLGVCPLQSMQYLVAHINPRPRLVLAQQC